jgi:uncharacterized protein (TIGR00251 family)
MAASSSNTSDARVTEPAFALTSLDSGASCLLDVRAQPGAKRSGVVGTWNGHLKVAVRAPAEDGRANAEVLEVLARALGLKGAALELVRGERARLKRVRIACAADVVRARLLSQLE